MEEQYNPARRRLRQPFLKRSNRPHPRPPQSSPPRPTKQPFCRAAIALKQSATKPLSASVPASTHQQPESERVDRELLRKKSQLLELNLKYIELQERYATLLQRSKRSGSSQCGEASTEQQRSIVVVGGARERLEAIKARLGRMDFSSACKAAGG